MLHGSKPDNFSGNGNAESNKFKDLSGKKGAIFKPLQPD